MDFTADYVIPVLKCCTCGVFPTTLKEKQQVRRGQRCTSCVRTVRLAREAKKTKIAEARNLKAKRLMKPALPARAPVAVPARAPAVLARRPAVRARNDTRATVAESREAREASEAELKAVVERYYSDPCKNVQRPHLADKIMFKYLPQWTPFRVRASAVGRVLLDLECLKRLASTTLEIVVAYSVDNEINVERVLLQNAFLGGPAGPAKLASSLLKVNHFPKGRRRRLKGFVLEYMAQGLEVNKRYREEEVNSILRSLMQPGFGEDVSTVRRALVETCLLSREMDCSFYWRTKVLPERAPTMYF